jgi:hypothetical protein
MCSRSMTFHGIALHRMVSPLADANVEGELNIAPRHLTASVTRVSLRYKGYRSSITDLLLFEVCEPWWVALVPITILNFKLLA